MKCEICKKADAQTAITRSSDDGEEELYVCHACAKAERQKAQKRSQRTRKITGLPGMSLSLTEFSDADADDYTDADETDETEETEGTEENTIDKIRSNFVEITHVMDEIVSDIQKKLDAHKAARQKAQAEQEYRQLSLEKVNPLFILRGRLHLEGLRLIGELDSVKRALHALKMDLVGVESDGLEDVGHIYNLRFQGAEEQALRVLEDLVREERNARVRLFEELPRVFGDTLCRSLALLKNCRLLSPAELFDMLSPLLLAAREKMLDGVTVRQIEKFLAEVDLTDSEERMDPDERDRIDGERADQTNRRFLDVVLNERAEEKFL